MISLFRFYTNASICNFFFCFKLVWILNFYFNFCSLVPYCVLIIIERLSRPSTFIDPALSYTVHVYLSIFNWVTVPSWVIISVQSRCLQCERWQGSKSICVVLSGTFGTFRLLRPLWLFYHACLTTVSVVRSGAIAFFSQSNCGLSISWLLVLFFVCREHWLMMTGQMDIGYHSSNDFKSCHDLSSLILSHHTDHPLHKSESDLWY